MKPEMSAFDVCVSKNRKGFAHCCELPHEILATQGPNLYRWNYCIDNVCPIGFYETDVMDYGVMEI